MSGSTSASSSSPRPPDTQPVPKGSTSSSPCARGSSEPLSCTSVSEPTSTHCPHRLRPALTEVRGHRCHRRPKRSSSRLRPTAPPSGTTHRRRHRYLRGRSRGRPPTYPAPIPDRRWDRSPWTCWTVQAPRRGPGRGLRPRYWGPTTFRRPRPQLQRHRGSRPRTRTSVVLLSTRRCRGPRRPSARSPPRTWIRWPDSPQGPDATGPLPWARAPPAGTHRRPLSRSRISGRPRTAARMQPPRRVRRPRASRASTTDVPSRLQDFMPPETHWAGRPGSTSPPAPAPT